MFNSRLLCTSERYSKKVCFFSLLNQQYGSEMRKDGKITELDQVALKVCSMEVFYGEYSIKFFFYKYYY